MNTVFPEEMSAKLATINVRKTQVINRSINNMLIINVIPKYGQNFSAPDLKNSEMENTSVFFLSLQNKPAVKNAFDTKKTRKSKGNPLKPEIIASLNPVPGSKKTAGLKLSYNSLVIILLPKTAKVVFLA